MKLGRLTLTYEVLGGLMGLPSGHSITAIFPQTGDDVANQMFGVLVTGPKLPEHHEGTMVVWVDMIRDKRGKTEFSS